MRPDRFLQRILLKKFPCGAEMEVNGASPTEFQQFSCFFIGRKRQICMLEGYGVYFYSQMGSRDIGKLFHALFDIFKANKTHRLHNRADV